MKKIWWDEYTKLHREDGPAVTTESGFLEVWYWHNEKFNPDNFDESWPDDKKVWWMRARLNNP